MSNKHWMFATLFLFALLLGASAFFAWQERHERVEPAQLTHKVMVVDVNHSGKISQEEIAQGKDAVLMVRMQSGPHAGVGQSFNAVSALIRLDWDKNGKLDARDPLFNSLELVYFTSQEKKIIPIKKAHIKEILLEPSVLKDQRQLPSNTLVGHAVTTEGKQLDIRLVSVEIEKEDK